MKKIILTYTALMLFLNCCKIEVSEEVYLIPRNFIGDLIIVYGHNGGKLDSIVGNKIIYKIPQNGVLYVSGHQHLQELSRMRYYYYDSKGFNEELCRYKIDKRNNCKAVVYNNRAESYQKNIYSHRFDFVVITVGRNDRIPNWSFDPEKTKFKIPH